MRLVWHRQDLRVHDHPALAEALRHGPVVGLAILEPDAPQPDDPRSDSPRRRALLGQNLRALRGAYRDRGGILLVRDGDPAAILPDLVRRLAVDRVHALARFTPAGIARDLATVRALREHGVGIRWHDGLYVHSPGTVRTAGDDVYSVFAPFFRRWTGLGTPDPLPAPDRIPAPDLPSGVSPGEIPLQAPDVELPPPGEAAALAALERFVDERLPAYADRRDRLDGRGTSRLSIWIASGVLSARTAAARVEAAGAAGAEAGAAWIRELAWRDFLADLLYHRPDLPDAPFHPRWKALSWPGGDDRFAAWRDGRTGVPVVDAAMRQLRETGWISNRARMVAAQFLAKNLRVDWRRGERLFRAWLLDGDLASNVGNWQWAAGLGIDNAPYFRVMSPDSQARKHDPDGAWLRRWAPADDDARRPLVDPSEGRADYLDAARRVPPADEAPPPPSPPPPALELATDARLAMVPGVSAAAATRMLDAFAANPHLSVEEASATGPALGTAIRRRFDADR